jgi:hypothetical protein
MILKIRLIKRICGLMFFLFDIAIAFEIAIAIELVSFWPCFHWQPKRDDL